MAYDPCTTCLYGGFPYFLATSAEHATFLISVYYPLSIHFHLHSFCSEVGFFQKILIQFFIGSLRFHGTSFVNTPELSLHEANSEAHLPMKAEIIAGRRRTSSPPRSGPSHNIKIVVQSKDGRVRSQTKRFMRRCIKNKELCEVCSKPDCMRCSNCL